MSKVLFLTHVGDPGGAEFKMLDFCEKLPFDCEIAYFQKGSLGEHMNKRALKGDVFEMPRSLIGFKRRDGILSALKIVPDALKFIKRLIGKLRYYDVLVGMSQNSFILCAVAKPLVQKPIIWCMNDLVSREHFSGGTVKLMVILGNLCADAVVVNSEASKAAWIKAGGNKQRVSVIYPGIDFGVFDEALKETDKINEIKGRYSPDHKPIIGLFGRITPWKGQEVFLRAIAEVPEAVGLIVGEAFFGEEAFLEKLKALAEELGIKDRVHFTGHVNEVPLYMAACDVIAHCSTAPEPFGLVIVEGLAAKKPVIATDGGGAAEIIKHGVNGYLYNRSDPDKLSYCIVSILSGDTSIVPDFAEDDDNFKYSLKNLIACFTSVINPLIQNHK
ncbi:MAG: glycosyltransferase family 4 protein [Micavibrio sp.]|nr:glycosyltransferase family 4 protein [Micavibrio sp.]